MDGNYAPDWDLPHAVGPEENWQESDCYWFFDAKAGIGGWQRVGQYLNQGVGQSSVFLYKIGGARYLDRSIEIPGAKCQRSETGQAVGPSTVECLSPQVMHYRYETAEAGLDLKFLESFYTPRDWVQALGEGRALATEAGHLEVGGRLVGTVKLKGETHEIDALAHRDRSWGPRNLYGLDVLWFCNGTAGPDLSWTCMDVRLSGGHKRTVGFIVRKGQTEDLVDVNVNILTGRDGVTPLRGFLTLRSASGSIDLEVHPVQGFMQRIAPGPFIVADHSSRIFVNGQEGFGDFGVVQNALRGEHIPSPEELSTTCVADGVSAFVPYEDELSPMVKRFLEER